MKTAQERSIDGSKGEMSFEGFQQEVLNDYRLIVESREASLLGRKEVLTGKAKFGIFGDGKELPQVVLSKFFRPGDWRSGYYRDQTLNFANGTANYQQFFSQLYANPSIEHDPFSSGRQMNSHFATRSLDEDGEWRNLMEIKNSSSDISPTAGQMARALGLAFASKVYKDSDLESDGFSNQGQEVVFCTIGDASTSEGVFWESINAAGVLQVPLAVFVWDDGYGISVPKEYQTTKGSISEVLAGFQTNEKGEGIDIYRVKGWDYVSLCETFEKGISKVRQEHRPAVFHIQELTQPQGHSTSGSHERYKTKERLAWETAHDCNTLMREWIISSAIATEEELEKIEAEAKQRVAEAKKNSWSDFKAPIKDKMAEVGELIDALAQVSPNAEALKQTLHGLKTAFDPIRKDVMKAAKKALRITVTEESPARTNLINWVKEREADHQQTFNSHLHSQSKLNVMDVPVVKPQYDSDAPLLNGYEILNRAFDDILGSNDKVYAFGEDVGEIGDVNQGFAGMQEKYGKNRVFDTGIREPTILGQGLGMALRGLRPIAEIQYLDYLVYGLLPLTDDLATLQYRTRGGQKAPLIVRTRGHRLEGIWHTGSPMGLVISALRGINVMVPRNMVQAVGFYHTLLKSDEPGLVVECLNGYRLKEKLPNNLFEFNVPLGIPETLQEGDDVTLVSYGSCLRIAENAIKMLEEMDISVELIDVQTLLPFDIHHLIVDSLEKTNKLVVLDEDVPGGASAYMLRHILEVQKGFQYLDAAPRTITAKPHRAAYGSDGDYFSKPNAEDIFESIYQLMHEYDPQQYPLIY